MVSEFKTGRISLGSSLGENKTGRIQAVYSMIAVQEFDTPYGNYKSFI